MTKSPVLGLGAVLILVSVACSDPEPPPPTRDEVISACEDLARVSCRKFGECLGQTAAEVDDCIADAIARCPGELEASDSCWANQLENYVDCSATTTSDSCDDTCNDQGFCFVYCSYVCPPVDAGMGG